MRRSALSANDASSRTAGLVVPKGSPKLENGIFPREHPKHSAKLVAKKNPSMLMGQGMTSEN
jgi:hypothetical protein